MTVVDEFLAAHGQRLVEVRRDLHAHPELSREERRTTTLVHDALAHVGLSPRVLPGGTGLLCDIGPAPARIALRADLDALPIPDLTGTRYRSTVDGVSHACGHDVHTTVVLGAGLALARLATDGGLQRGVRLIFQPAEEALPGGALDVMAAGGLDGIERIYALHCDPSLDVGTVGLRVGPITSASDHVEVRLAGPGGHTARPHLTVDLVAALGAVVTQTPGLLARRVDPRGGVLLVWGQAAAGTAGNVIPRTGVARGTVRTPSRELWATLPPQLEKVVREVAAPYGASVEVSYTRGVPPVVNDAESVAALATAVRSDPKIGTATDTAQSLGGEDFGWYAEEVPGALARLGVRPIGSSGSLDLHQSNFDVDERCIAVGVRLLVGVASAPA
ncbi:MAG TPA: amidohydrolase [Mycobacteriales bacterium]|nr:amidohydrolase [Mycobacteriales bacterium]